MVSTYTTNKNIEKPGSGDYANTWNVPVNSDWDVIDRSFGGVQVMNPTSVSGTVVLTSTQYQPQILVVGASISATATLTANVNYQIPSGVGGVWTVYNNTTGAFTITISSGGGGTTQEISQGLHTLVYSDGTNIFRAENSVPTIIPAGTKMLFFQAAAPTGWTQYTTNIDNRALRVVDGAAGGGVGGAVGFSDVFSGSNSVGSTAITEAQMPSHTHGVNDPGHIHGLSQLWSNNNILGRQGFFDRALAGPTGYTTDGATTGIYLNYTGGGNGHTHTIPALSYANVIICTKN
jgi:hypothetical protein